jgi:hypothetical protein
MSYDIDIHDEYFNYTYNCAQMFVLAFGRDEGIYILNGKCGRTAAILLSDAIEFFHKNEAKLQKHTPSNGWGGYESALAFLNALRAACLRNTRRRVRVA